jgi:hypothetical protein
MLNGGSPRGRATGSDAMEFAGKPAGGGENRLY